MNCANHPDRERISFCQNCGKPLCAECSRAIGTGVFCEPCLTARLAGVDAAAGVPPFGSQTVAGIPIPANSGAPNPVLAAFLGFIPGVGAMYNGQYAKGVVHLVVFAVLVSLADHADGIFGLFVAGWEFYMAFEAYHTARARRDGTPLPNPFGLNDIGERFGFGKGWTPAVGTPVAPITDSFTQPANPAQAYTAPPPSWNATPNYSQPYTYAPPPVQPYAPIPTEPPYAAVPPQDRFPTGAIILIGLGLLFFFGSTGILRGFPIQHLIPFFLIGFGVWLFIRRMTADGQPLDDDGSPFYRQRVFAALRGSVWVILVGILFLLDTFHILSWARSWPLFIIVAGLMTIVQRYSYATPAAAFPYAPSPVQPGPVAPSTTSTEIAPTQEGR